MSKIKGKDATIKKNSVAVAYMHEWNINVAIDEEDLSDFGDDWKEVGGNLAEWDGDMTGFFDPTNTEQKAMHDALITAAPTGELTDVTFYLTGSLYYSGNILITNISISVAASGHIKIKISFKGNGALTYNS
jgi:hypothetical protein